MKSKKMQLIACAAALALTLTACSGNGSQSGKQESGSETKVAAAPSQALKMGVMFSPADTLDPATMSSGGMSAVVFNVFDSLAMLTDDGLARMHLAESITPNETATEWTIKLRPGIKYSDGTDVKAQDIIESFKNFAHSQNYSQMYGNIDFDKSTAEGSTAVIALHSPESDFVESVVALFSPIAPGGEFTKGIGAGPYVVKSGDASTGFTLSANDTYWDGKPAIPEITFVPVSSAAELPEALKTQEIDYAYGLDSAALQALKGVEGIEFPQATLASAGAMELALNTRIAPFNDPELRKAAKLAVDRDKLVNTLLGDSGEIGNDMLGKGYKTYATDIEQTKMKKDEAAKIFAAKGVKEFTIAASDAMVPGNIKAAELMAQDFKDIGVTVNVEQKDPQSFFSELGDIEKTASAITFSWINRAPMAEFPMEFSDTPYNVAGYTSDAITENLNTAKSTLDPAVRQKALDAISRDNHDNGGEIIWGYQKQINAHRAGLKNVENFQTMPWLAKATFTPNS